MDPTPIDTPRTFSEACGGSLHLEIRSPDETTGVRRAFDQPFLVVGRSPDSDLMLDDEEVSWRHCYLQRLSGCLVCIDLNSQNGIAIEGVSQRIGWIAPGQTLQIGPVTVRFLEPAASAEPGTDARDGSRRLHPFSAQYARDLPPAALEIEGTVGTPYGWRMSRALALVGRSSGCQVRLVDDRISRFHAALVRTPTGVWVVDLLSREGVVVDGANVRAAKLDEGGICQLGPFTLRHYRETFAPAPPRRSRSLPARVEPRAGGLDGLAARSGYTPDGSMMPAGWSVGHPAAGSSAPVPPPDWGRAETGPDPYQQAIMTLAQMLGAMHNDHMNLVRDELVEIRRLAEEMHAMREEIGRRPAEPPAAPVIPPIPMAPQHFGTAGAGIPGSTPGALPPGAIDPALGAMAASAFPPGEPGRSPLAPPVSRDPRECLAIASSFLASYEQRQNGHWSRIVRLLSGLTGGSALGPDRARSPLGQAPLG